MPPPFAAKAPATPPQFALGELLGNQRRRHQQIPMETRVAILAAIAQGQKKSDVAQQFGVSAPAIFRLLKHVEKTGKLEPSPRSGRPRTKGIPGAPKAKTPNRDYTSNITKRNPDGTIAATKKKKAKDTVLEPDKLYVEAAEAARFTARILVGNGVPIENAATIANALVLADLRGVDTHGINRIPSYMIRIRQGVLDAQASPEITKITPCVAQVDGKNAFGFLSAARGMNCAIEMAKEFGIGMVSVKHSNHFGMSAWIVQQAIDANMMSLVFTNSSPALPVFGSKDKFLGVSPIACGAPAGKERPFILDMAPSVAARGKVYKAKTRGERIPWGWALDKDGKPTDNPAKALSGVMLPMGGPKGSALAIMMDVFSGVFSGSAFAGGVTGPYEPTRASDVGHFLVAIKPDLFMSLEDFKARMDHLYQKVVSAEKLPDVERIYYPGEIEQLAEEERLQTGIPFVQAEIDALNAEAQRIGQPLLQIKQQPMEEAV